MFTPRDPPTPAERLRAWDRARRRSAVRLLATAKPLQAAGKSPQDLLLLVCQTPLGLQEPLTPEMLTFAIWIAASEGSVDEAVVAEKLKLADAPVVKVADAERWLPEEVRKVFEAVERLGLLKPVGWRTRLRIPGAEAALVRVAWARAANWGQELVKQLDFDLTRAGALAAGEDAPQWEQVVLCVIGTQLVELTLRLEKHGADLLASLRDRASEQGAEYEIKGVVTLSAQGASTQVILDFVLGATRIDQILLEDVFSGALAQSADHITPTWSLVEVKRG